MVKIVGKIENLIDIVGDGIIGHPDVGDGRMIPALVLDCKSRPDIYDLIMFHYGQPPGDVVSTWTINALNSDIIFLTLEFKRPTPGNLALEFNLKKNLALVDGIIRSNAAYIHHNKHGDKVSENYGKGGLIVEVPCDGAPFNWEKLFRKKLKRNFKLAGCRTREIPKQVEAAVKMSSDLWGLRRR